MVNHRLQPVSRVFGLDRGQSIARYYIEQFLRQNAAYTRGRVLEIDPRYTLQCGKDRVTSSDGVIYDFNFSWVNERRLVADAGTETL
jgi:hypothetical protein